MWMGRRRLATATVVVAGLGTAFWLALLVAYLPRYLWWNDACRPRDDEYDTDRGMDRDRRDPTDDDGGMRLLLVADPQMEGDGRRRQQGWVGAFEVAFNDRYFRHVIDNAYRYLRPTHVVVLGDLFSTATLDDAEFQRRVDRFRGIFDQEGYPTVPLINLTGNHDVGYGAHLSRKILRRWEAVFGPANAKFEAQGHVLAAVNSVSIDGVVDAELRDETWAFLESLRAEDRPIVFLTHIPLEKPAGSCSDSPETQFTTVGYVEWQNMLSAESSRFILDNIRPKVILSGHDHEGCTYVHDGAVPEYTVRSIMADYGGYIAVLDVYRTPLGAFRYQFAYCPFHTHVVLKTALVVGPLWLAGSALLLLSEVGVLRLCRRLPSSVKRTA